MNFENKVIIITGASSGIGAGTAEYFAKYNANISLIGRNQDNLQKTADNCKKINQNCKILTIVADVTKESQKIIDETIKHFRQLDVLINNAGILAIGNLTDIDVDQLDSVFDTNVRAVFQLTKLAVPYLIKTKGNIVNVSSLPGLRSFPGASVYCMSKAALDQFTRCVALELAPMGVRVNAVNPAVIVTDIQKRGMGMTGNVLEKHLEESKKSHPLGRVGTVDEVAAAIAFLANHEASFITGTTLPVDAGRSIVCP